MSRLVCAVVMSVCIFALGFAPAALAQTAPFQGTWLLNLGKSELDTPAPKNETRTYGLTNVEAALTIIVEGTDADGKPYAYGATGDINGHEYPVPGRDVGARILGDAISWKAIDPNTVEMTVKKKGEVINTTRHSVSADGKTLTVSENGVDGEGKVHHTVKVYDRQ